MKQMPPLDTKDNPHVFDSIRYLWNHFTLRRKAEFSVILVLTLITSVLEVIGIGLVLPFLAILNNPIDGLNHEYVYPIVQYLGITNSDNFINMFAMIFIIAIAIAAFFRLLLLYLITKLSYSAGGDIGVEIYRRTLYQDFSVHMLRNSSEIINGIVLKSNIAIGTIQSVLMLLSSIIMLTIVLGTLVSINPEIAILLLFGFMSFYWLVSFYTRRSIKSNSELISKNSNGIIKIVQEGLGGIRDVIIDNSQNYYCAEYRKIDVPLRKALGDNSFIGSSPRYIIEATGMMVIILVSLNMADDPNSSHSIPVLGMIALAMQKILPLIQQGYKGFTVIKSSYASFNDVVALLKQPLPNYLKKKNHAQISYKKEITLSNVNFKYSADAPWILKNINLKIKKGSVIGIIGETGSGKSTLVDIIMGLLDPIEGNLLIDGKMINGSNRRSWQSHIAHVPQSIYLLDGSIEQNIAFGESEEKIDYDKLGAVSKMAQISDLISLNKGKLSNVTGERGGRLSGGQRQRIGIARAFYKNSDVLVLDEATSALDEKTEKAIMKSIENISDELTIIIIAHRLSTLKNCDSILKISNKKIAHINSVKDIYNDKK